MILKAETQAYRMGNSLPLRRQYIVAERAQNLELENLRFKCRFCLFLDMRPGGQLR